MPLLRLLIILFTASALAAAEPSASTLAKRAKKAEKRGEFVLAYGLYAQAAAKDPKYWAKAQTLQRDALKSSPETLRALLDTEDPQLAPAQPGPADTPPTPPLSLAEQQEIRQLAPPPTLIDDGKRLDFDLADNVRYLYEKVAKDFGYLAILDQELLPKGNIRLRLQKASLHETLRYLMIATGTIVVPLDARAFYVTLDTPQKRLEREQNISISVPIPDTVTTQEAVEVGTALRAVFQLQRIHVDANSRTVFIRDTASKVRPAVMQLHALMAAKAEVLLEVDFLDVTSTSSNSFGLNLPTSFQIINLGGFWQTTPDLGSIALNSLATFGGGQTLIGIGITGAQLLLRANQTDNRTLYSATLRASNGTPATLNIGERYPLITTFFAQGAQEQQQANAQFAPQIQFENLGFNLKITPRIHDQQEVTLDIETEFKTLGALSFSGFPSIATKRLQSQVRLQNGEWAVVGGLLNINDTRALAGLSGLSQIPLIGPLLGSRTLDKTKGNVLIVIKPRVVIAPTSAVASKELYLGTETRPFLPL